jgi:hypothetical protein
VREFITGMVLTETGTLRTALPPSPSVTVQVTV